MIDAYRIADAPMKNKAIMAKAKIYLGPRALKFMTKGELIAADQIFTSKMSEFQILCTYVRKHGHACNI